jgi:hypothetical protein
MKLRVGLVSTSREDLEKIKKEFPDFIFIFAKNVMELAQHSSVKNLDAIILMGTNDTLSKEFLGCFSYLRQKSIFKQTPIITLAQSKILANAPIQDKKVRSYSTQLGLFAPMMDYFTSITNIKGEHNITEEYLLAEFRDAISRKYNKSGTIEIRASTPDESHTKFLSQDNFEVASNLYWVKFSSRVLNINAEGLMKDFGAADEAALATSLSNLQQGIYSTFKEHIDELLDSKGAMYFKKSDQLSMPDKAPFIKKAKSQTYTFQSPSIAIVLEVIQYL